MSPTPNAIKIKKKTMGKAAMIDPLSEKTTVDNAKQNNKIPEDTEKAKRRTVAQKSKASSISIASKNSVSCSEESFFSSSSSAKSSSIEPNSLMTVPMASFSLLQLVHSNGLP